MDKFLLTYCAEMRKIVRAEREAERRARAKGVAPSVSNAATERRLQLEDGVFHCTYGCTPATTARRITPPGKCPKKVEFETTHVAMEQLRLRAEMNEMKLMHSEDMQRAFTQMEETKRDLRHAMLAEQDNAERASKAARLADKHQAEQALSEVKAEVDAAHKELRRMDREAVRERQKTTGEILRLGGQVARSQMEAERQALRQEKAVAKARAEVERARVEANADAERARAQAEAVAERAKAEAAQEIELARTEAERCKEVAKARLKERMKVEREAARERRMAQAKLLVLEGHVAMAHHEAGEGAKGAAKAAQEIALAKAEAERLDAIAKASLKEQQVAEQEAAEELRKAQAELMKLGLQLGKEHQEHGRTFQRSAALMGENETLRQEMQLLAETAAVVQEKWKQATLKKHGAEREKERVLETSRKRLKAKKELEDGLSHLKAENEQLRTQLDNLLAERDQNAGAAAKLMGMPTWTHERKRGKRGGGLQLQYEHRLAILEQHANGTPSSAIGRNIISVVTKAAPWLDPVEPTPGEIRKIGFELPTLEEALAARRTAAACRVRLLGFDETSDNQDPVMTSNIQVQDVEGGPMEDVVLKAAYLCTKGSTSEAIVTLIEEKCFARLRELLRTWKKYHDTMFPEAAWTGPNPAMCSLHRLAGGGALMSDTCNAARKAKRLLSELVKSKAEEALRSDLGGDNWEAKTAEEREECLRVHRLDCQHHLRNIWSGHMSRKQAQHVQQALADKLQHFSSWERMTTEFDQLLRGVYKEFHAGGRYYKGKAADFASWLLEKYPHIFFMHIERADGGRQDLDYDAAVPIYVGRRYMVEYIHSHVFSSGHKNILEDFLYQALMTMEFIAMARVNAAFDLRIARPHRWLAGKSALLDNWSPIKMNYVLDLIDAAFQKIRDDGAALLDPEWDIFAPVAESQPLFREYLNFTYNQDVVLSPDGTVRHLHYKLALAEVLNPEDETNRRTRDKTIEYAQVQAAAALEKMYDPKLAIADKLTSQDGENCFAKQSQAHEDLLGCNATNDATAESVFGAWKLERRRNPGISVRRSSGLAHARISKSLAYDNAVRHRKRNVAAARKAAKEKRQSGMFGYFHKRVPETERIALIEMCRAERAKQRQLDREDWEELHNFRVAQRQSNVELELEALVKSFALALSFYDRYKQRGVNSAADIEPALQSLASTQLQLDWLREQVEMRVLGLGWIEFKTNWSSGADEHVGTVPALVDQLKDILEAELEREIPSFAPAPIMQRKTFKELGTPTIQAELLGDQQLMRSSAELRQAAERERERLEQIGELDIVGDLQPATPPPLNEELVGCKLEIHWRYWRPAEEGETGTKKQVYIWCEGTVEQVADGKIRKSKRSKEALPAGAVRIRWPADSEYEENETLVWSILNPSDWCKAVHLGWRWAPSEVRRLARNARAGESAGCSSDAA